MPQAPLVAWSTGVGQADWIRDRLSPLDSGVVTSVVPGGFEAYARILHPARDAAERPIRWSHVARGAGRTAAMTRSVQFHEIAIGPPPVQPHTLVLASRPEEGSLDPGYAAALCQILREETAEPDNCLFAMWDGYGWEPGARRQLRSEDGLVDGDASDEGEPDPCDLVPREVRDGPLVELPHREYFLYQGPVEDALAFVAAQQQTANLWWARDRSWCVATELDLEFTYIGGSADLIRRVLSSPDVEAVDALPADSHHRCVATWLQAAIETATTALLVHGSAAIDTDRGTVTASLKRPRRLRDGALETERVSLDGSGGNGWSRLSWRGGEAALRRGITFDLEHAVFSLLN